MERNMLFDSLKFGLICLMVFGHCIQFNSGHIKDTVFGFIYTFHMPLFIFISGFFSKNITWKKYKRSFISLVITFSIFQFIYSVPLLYVGLKEWFTFFIMPKGWYILGLIVWRFLFLITKDYISRKVLLSISFIFPLCVGFLDYNILMFRIFTFFPYFLLGAYCQEFQILKIREIKKSYAISILIIFFILIYFFINQEFTNTLFGEGSYITNCSTRIYGFIYRVLAYASAIVVSIGVINLMPDTIGKYGSQTLEIYLMHHVILNIFYYSGIFSSIEFICFAIFPSFDFYPNLLSDLGISAIIIIICLYLNKFKIVKYIMSPLPLLEKMNIKI